MYDKKNERNSDKDRICFIAGSFFFKKNGRGGQTRTDNPSLPKRVRYQLRYIPTYISNSLDRHLFQLRHPAAVKQKPEFHAARSLRAPRARMKKK